eukprot:jgi/Ulvmu1/9784/UM056_0024.1
MQMCLQERSFGSSDLARLTSQCCSSSWTAQGPDSKTHLTTMRKLEQLRDSDTCIALQVIHVHQFTLLDQAKATVVLTRQESRFDNETPQSCHGLHQEQQFF